MNVQQLETHHSCRINVITLYTHTKQVVRDPATQPETLGFGMFHFQNSCLAQDTFGNLTCLNVLMGVLLDVI